jgi:hypothetical protein
MASASCRANGKRSPSDIAFPYPVPAGSRLSDYGLTRKHPEFRRNNLRRIEFHFHYLSMPGLICANIFIGRISFVPPAPTAVDRRPLNCGKFLPPPKQPAPNVACLHRDHGAILAPRTTRLCHSRISNSLSRKRAATISHGKNVDKCGGFLA